MNQINGYDIYMAILDIERGGKRGCLFMSIYVRIADTYFLL